MELIQGNLFALVVPVRPSEVRVRFSEDGEKKKQSVNMHSLHEASRRFLFETMIFRGYVSSRGCTFIPSNDKQNLNLN